MSSSFNFKQSRPTLVSPHEGAERPPTWRRAFGCLFLLLALVLLGASAGLVLTAPAPAGEDGAALAAATAVQSEAPATATVEPKATNTDQPSDAIGGPLPKQMSTLSAAQIADLLATPPEVIDEDQAMAITGLSYDPFTIATNRSRTRMTSYTVVSGDTVDTISKRFGLARETIAWCNSYRKAQVLFAGDSLNIPPADGACHTVLASQGKDISVIAEQYGIDDPYVIIDAPANDLPEIPPDTQLPSGTRLFIPGGAGSIITWNAPVEEDAAGNVIAFARGHPNSCGAVPGGGTFWTNPLPNGSYVRGFYAGHSGIDIAASSGTPSPGGKWRTGSLCRLEQLGIRQYRRHRPRTLLDALRPHEQPGRALRKCGLGRSSHWLRRQHRQFLGTAFALRDSLSQPAPRSIGDPGYRLVRTLTKISSRAFVTATDDSNLRQSGSFWSR